MGQWSTVSSPPLKHYRGSIEYSSDNPYIQLHHLHLHRDRQILWDFSAGVNSVIKRRSHCEMRLGNQSLMPVGKVLTGSTAVFVHFVCSCSKGNERLLCITIRAKENRSNQWRLMVTKKCVRQHSSVPDISAGLSTRVISYIMYVVKPGY